MANYFHSVLTSEKPQSNNWRKARLISANEKDDEITIDRYRSYVFQARQWNRVKQIPSLAMCSVTT